MKRKLEREMSNLTYDDICDLMCGKPEEDNDDFKECNSCIYQDLQYSKRLGTYISSCTRSSGCKYKKKKKGD